MSTPHPCKHLDYTEGRYGPDIELKTLPEPYQHVRFWHRGETWTDNEPGHPRNASDVQFCGQGRGRINSILECYLGERPCYEPEPKP